MKIRPEQLEALKQQEASRSRPRPGTKEFEDMLAQEVQRSGEGTQVGKTQAPPPGGGVAGTTALLAMDGVSQVEPVRKTEHEIMENIDSLLAKWEDYAAHLQDGGPESGLKRANGVLENIESDVGQLKTSAGKLDQADPALKSMVDEMEIMTVAERIKFNRGDYL